MDYDTGGYPLATYPEIPGVKYVDPLSYPEIPGVKYVDPLSYSEIPGVKYVDPFRTLECPAGSSTLLVPFPVIPLASLWGYAETPRRVRPGGSAPRSPKKLLLNSQGTTTIAPEFEFVGYIKVCVLYTFKLGFTTTCNNDLWLLTMGAYSGFGLSFTKVVNLWTDPVA